LDVSRLSSKIFTLGEEGYVSGGAKGGFSLKRSITSISSRNLLLLVDLLKY